MNLFDEKFSHAHFEFLLSTTKNLLLLNFSIFVLSQFAIALFSSSLFARFLVAGSNRACVGSYSELYGIRAFGIFISIWRDICVRAYANKYTFIYIDIWWMWWTSKCVRVFVVLCCEAMLRVGLVDDDHPGYNHSYYATVLTPTHAMMYVCV